MFATNIRIFIVLLIFFQSTIASFAQDWEWAFGVKGSDFDYSSAIATDIDGNIYVAGYFSSPNISFNSLTFQNKGGKIFSSQNLIIMVMLFGSKHLEEIGTIKQLQ